MAEKIRQMNLLFWRGLCHVAERETLSVEEVCDLIERNRGENDFEQAVRCFTVAYARATAIETMQNYIPPVIVPNEDDHKEKICCAG